jgi:hypothetical protein
VKTKARADYKFMPEWPHFDLQKKEPYGWLGRAVTLHVSTAPDNADAKQPRWVRMEDLGEDHILPGEVWDRISDAIDERCEVEDAKRRQAAKSKSRPVLE